LEVKNINYTINYCSVKFKKTLFHYLTEFLDAERLEEEVSG